MVGVERPSPAVTLHSRSWLDDVLADRLLPSRGDEIAAVEFSRVAGTYLNMSGAVTTPAPGSDHRGLAADLGMSKATLVRTINGERWLSLPEYAAALASPRISAALVAGDTPVRDALLHRMIESRPASRISPDPDASHGTLMGNQPEMKEHEVMAPDVARAKFEHLVTLVRELEAAQFAGCLPVDMLPFTVRNWTRIRELIEGEQPLASLARTALANGEEWTVTGVRRFMEQQGRWADATQVGRSLDLLRQRGDAERPHRATYRRPARDNSVPVADTTASRRPSR
jgi:hypothetical protein